jgi:hypothetical protein
MSTQSYESTIINAPVDRVWKVVKAGKFSPNVKSIDFEGGASENTVGAVRRITFVDGTVQRVRLLELSDHSRSLSWEIIESIPAISYLAATHRIAIKPVTDTNKSFVQAFTDFSKDASNEVLADSRFKKLDLFKSLAASTESRFAQFLAGINLDSV